VRSARKCVWCGKMHTVGRKYCSNECRRADKRGYSIESTKCANCLQSFMPRRKDQKYCSISCRRAKYYKVTQKDKVLQLRKTPNGKINHAMGSRIRRWVNGGKQGRSWVELVGYSAEELVEHIERGMEEGMSWDNYGEWHIDHVVPLAAFDFNSYDDLQFRQAWELKNLMPRWATTEIAEANGSTQVGNINKGAILQGEFQPMLPMRSSRKYVRMQKHQDNARHHKHALELRLCVWCGSVFTTRVNRYCSQDCRCKHKQAKAKRLKTGSRSRRYSKHPLVSYTNNRWRVQIKRGGVRVFTAYADTEAEAVDKRNVALMNIDGCVRYA